MWLTIRAILRIIWKPIKKKSIGLYDKSLLLAHKVVGIIKQTPSAAKMLISFLIDLVRKTPFAIWYRLKKFGHGVIWFVITLIKILGWLLLWPYNLLDFVGYSLERWKSKYGQIAADNRSCGFVLADIILMIASLVVGILGLCNLYSSERYLALLLIPLICSLVKVIWAATIPPILRLKTKVSARVAQERREILDEQKPREPRRTPVEALVRPSEPPNTDVRLVEAEPTSAQLLRPTE